MRQHETRFILMNTLSRTRFKLPILCPKTGNNLNEFNLYTIEGNKG